MESEELEKSQDVPMQEDEKAMEVEESKNDAETQNEIDNNKNKDAEEQKEESEHKDKEKAEENKERKRKRSYSGSSSSGSSSSSDSEEEKNEAKSEEKKEGNGEKQEDEANKIETIEDDVKVEKPRALHKTTSIFLRSLAPTITKQEIEAICSRYFCFYFKYYCYLLQWSRYIGLMVFFASRWLILSRKGGGYVEDGLLSREMQI